MFHRIFLDTNILLDVVLNRELFVADTEKIFLLQDEGHLTIYVSALTLANVAHIVKRNGKDPYKVIESIIKWVEVVDLELNHFEKTLYSKFKDFEDGLQFFSASEINNIDAIITRDKSDFKTSTIPVYTPREFLKHFNP